MTDDDVVRELTNAVILELVPLRDVMARVLTLVEDLTRRVEVLELERLQQQPSKMTDAEAGRTDVSPSVQP